MANYWTAITLYSLSMNSQIYLNMETALEEALEESRIQATLFHVNTNIKFLICERQILLFHSLYLNC